MEVSRWMTRSPVVVGSNENLAVVRNKMEQGGFHRVPVVDNGKLVGIVSDRDLRQHVGTLERVKVNGVMTQPVVTLTPTTMLEQAANLMVRHKIGGVPVVEQGKVVGMLTATDLMRAFAEVLGGTQEGVSRIDLALAGDSSELAMVVQLVSQESCEILGVGSYQAGEEGGQRVVYLRLRSGDASRVARMLTDNSYKVLSIHS
jgi:acetoin utilization protein AcuB